MTERNTKARGPGTDVADEMHQCQGTVAAGESAQQGEGDRVIAAERAEVRERRRLRLDLGKRARDVAVGDVEIADIGEIEPLHLGPGRRAIAINEHAARLADGGRTKSRPRPG